MPALLLMPELLGVALAGLRARPLRTLLMAAGPGLGVAVIIGAFGVLQSTSGELRTALERLGNDLVVVTATDGEDPRLPVEAANRVAGIPSVEGVTATGAVRGISAAAVSLPDGLPNPIANAVLSADARLLEVLETGVALGRVLGPADEAGATTAAVVGARVARLLGIGPGEMQTVYLNEHAFGVVGALEPSILLSDLDFAVLIPASTAERVFGANPAPSQLYVRIEDGAVREAAEILGVTATYEGSGLPSVSIPADLLAAQAEVDRTLAGAVWGLGLLAIGVGGFGIANVMLISVLERRREIGVRRALGHLRSVIAAQFISEAVLVGLLGAAVGAVIGATFVVVVSEVRGWVAVVDPLVLAAAMGASVLVTALAGVYPAIRAARMQPMDAVRGD